MSRRLRQEDGFALILALGITIVLAILVTSMISYTSSGQRAAQLSTADGQASYYAEGGASAAYSNIIKVNTTIGGNPTAANMLGCAGATGPSDTNGPSNCSSANLVPKVICITTT